MHTAPKLKGVCTAVAGGCYVARLLGARAFGESAGEAKTRVANKCYAAGRMSADLIDWGDGCPTVLIPTLLESGPFYLTASKETLT
jgi:hypothetical protein